MTSAGQRVINIAARHVGVHEVPNGSNRGELIDEWQAHWGMRGEPWCGMFASAVYREANVKDVSHPATAEICRRGLVMGWTSRTPVPGALVVWCGTHVEILVSQVSPGVWRTIGGNTGNEVAWRTRSLDGTTIVVPPGLEHEPTPVRTYWIEDPRAQPILRGPWRSQAARDRVLASLPAGRRAHARKVRTAKGRYAFLEGPRRLYGPWADKAARDGALPTLQKRIGHTLRPFSRTAD